MIHAVEKAVPVEPVGEFALKGIRRPMMTYNVLETSPAKPNRCLLWAQSRHSNALCGCPLSGVKRTSINTATMSPNDPKRKWHEFYSVFTINRPRSKSRSPNGAQISAHELTPNDQSADKDRVDDVLDRTIENKA